MLLVEQASRSVGSADAMTNAEPPRPDNTRRGDDPNGIAGRTPSSGPASADAGNTTHAYRELTAVERILGNRPTRF
jgi:hypothetical protein